METELASPHPEVHEANSKKLQPTFGFSVDRKPDDFAGRIMFLPDGWIEGVHQAYGYRKHPVMILSPSVSRDNNVEILGMTTFGGKSLEKKFRIKKERGREEVLRKRARYFPIEPSPAHPDRPETNVTLRMVPSNPKKYSYIDVSAQSRLSVPFKELREYLPYGHYGVHPTFYLDRDSYQKLAAFLGISTIGLLRSPADPVVEKESTGKRLTEQLVVPSSHDLQGSFLASHIAVDMDVPLLALDQKEEPAITQMPDASELPVSTQTQPTSFTLSNHHDDNTYNTLEPSKPVWNNISLILAFVALLAAGRALSRNSAVREIATGDKAKMLVGASKKLRAAVLGGLSSMGWMVVQHFMSGRN